MPRQLKESVLFVLTAIVLASGSAHAQSVTVGNPTRAYNHGAPAYLYQNGQEQGWGQTFRTPDALHTRLDTWSQWFGALSPDLPGALLDYRLQIFEWSANTLAGSAL